MLKYHVLKGAALNERQDINDDVSLIAFLDEHNQIKGEFFASDYTDIKIKYNTQTGRVSVVSSAPPQGVTFLYSAKSFNTILEPLKDILILRNKRDFLLALSQISMLNLASFIKEHLDENGKFTRKLNLADVDGTLRRIKKHASNMLFSFLKGNNHSAQYAACEILSGKDILNIKTKKEADLIIQMINECLGVKIDNHSQIVSKKLK